MLTNAHLHFNESFSPAAFSDRLVCFSTGSKEEWEEVSAFAAKVNAAREGLVPGGASCLVSAGLHPWTLEKYAADDIDPHDRLHWLEELLADKGEKVAAVGECGIDLYTPQLRGLLSLQLSVFEKQVALAVRYEKALVVHCRRSIQYFFKYKEELKKLPSVIFHAFPGTLTECESLLDQGINAFFSFGNVFLRGGRKASECVRNLPENRLLLETDSSDDELCLLNSVFKAAAESRSLPESDLEEVCLRNFCRAYCLS
ncbi:MAG: TatD family hydrolase [Treponemataceae bacterium]|nr:TatD family hydrolase [Treponemataceae bacterium]